MKKLIGIAILIGLIVAGVVFYRNLQQAVTIDNITLDATLATRDTVEIELNMVVDNPFLFSFDLQQLTYHVSVAGEELISEHHEIQQTVDDSTYLQIPVALNYPQVMSKMQKLENQDSTFLSLDVDVSYTVPLLGTLNTSARSTRQIPVPAMPDIQITDIDTKSFGFKNIALDLHIMVDNPSERAMKLDDLVFNVTLNESSIVKGMKWQTIEIPREQQTTFTLPVEVRTGALAQEFFEQLTGEELNLYLDGSALLIVPDSPIDSIPMKIDTDGPIKL